MLRCAICGYDFRASVTVTGGTCPECGRSYSRRDLDNLFEPPDLEGQPASFPRHERRISGRLLVILFLGVILVIAAITAWLSVM